jgi:hypothetical protein
MATATFTRIMGNFQHLTWLIPERQSSTLNSSCKNLRASFVLYVLILLMQTMNSFSHILIKNGRVSDAAILKETIFTDCQRKIT